MNIVTEFVKKHPKKFEVHPIVGDFLDELKKATGDDLSKVPEFKKKMSELFDSFDSLIEFIIENGSVDFFDSDPKNKDKILITDQSFILPLFFATKESDPQGLAAASRADKKMVKFFEEKQYVNFVGGPISFKNAEMNVYWFFGLAFLAVNFPDDLGFLIKDYEWKIEGYKDKVDIMALVRPMNQFFLGSENELAPGEYLFRVKNGKKVGDVSAYTSSESSGITSFFNGLGFSLIEAAKKNLEEITSVDDVKVKVDINAFFVEYIKVDDKGKKITNGKNSEVWKDFSEDIIKAINKAKGGKEGKGLSAKKKERPAPKPFEESESEEEDSEEEESSSESESSGEEKKKSSRKKSSKKASSRKKSSQKSEEQFETSELSTLEKEEIEKIQGLEAPSNLVLKPINK